MSLDLQNHCCDNNNKEKYSFIRLNIERSRVEVMEAKML